MQPFEGSLALLLTTCHCLHSNTAETPQQDLNQDQHQDQANMTIQIVPLGAGQDVGRSCILVTIGGKNIMLDCGMHMGFNGSHFFCNAGAPLASLVRLLA